MAKDEYGLTPRQRAYCDYYIECGNGREAAIKAGYKKPDISARENNSKPACKQYIAMRMKPTQEKRIADADEVLQYLSDVMRGVVKDQFGLDASLQDRTKAAQELMKRYAVADMRQQGTMARLDRLFAEFRIAVTQDDSSAPTSTQQRGDSPPQQATAAAPPPDV